MLSTETTRALLRPTSSLTGSSSQSLPSLLYIITLPVFSVPYRPNNRDQPYHVPTNHYQSGLHAYTSKSARNDSKWQCQRQELTDYSIIMTRLVPSYQYWPVSRLHQTHASHRPWKTTSLHPGSADEVEDLNSVEDFCVPVLIDGGSTCYHNLWLVIPL